MSLEDWAHLGTIIEALVVFCAAVFAVIQLREAVRARSLDCFLPLSRDLKEQAKARRSIYTRFRELAQEGIDRWEGVPKTGLSRRFLATLRRVFDCDTARFMPELISMPVIPQDSYESLESQDPMSDGEKEDVESVCVTFDRMGVLVK